MSSKVSQATKKHMVCVGCKVEIVASTAQASRHGWKFWMGGARCANCIEKGEPTTQTTQQGPVTCLICLAGDEDG